MKVDPLDTDATMAGRQRSRCDAQETWMPQAAASRTSSWPLSLPPPADYPGHREPFFHRLLRGQREGGL
jgi:hypothetical protein